MSNYIVYPGSTYYANWIHPSNLLYACVLYVIPFKIILSSPIFFFISFSLLPQNLFVSFSQKQLCLNVVVRTPSLIAWQGAIGSLFIFCCYPFFVLVSYHAFTLNLSPPASPPPSPSIWHTIWTLYISQYLRCKEELPNLSSSHDWPQHTWNDATNMRICDNE